MFYTIYKITNKINGKIYIGKHQTKVLNDGYMGSGKHLKRAIEKYGVENFEKEIIFQFDNEADMNAKEAELVTEEFVKKDTNYNLCLGGKGGFSYLNNHYWTYIKRSSVLGELGGFSKQKTLPTDSRIRILEGSKKGAKKASSKLKEYNKKVSLGIIPNGFKGKQHTKETKEKMSLTKKNTGTGKQNSQYGTTWIWKKELGNKKIKKSELEFYLSQGWENTYKPGYRV